jgi:hypothetical protein
MKTYWILVLRFLIVGQWPGPAGVTGEDRDGFDANSTDLPEWEGRRPRLTATDGADYRGWENCVSPRPPSADPAVTARRYRARRRKGQVSGAFPSAAKGEVSRLTRIVPPGPALSRMRFFLGIRGTGRVFAHGHQACTQHRRPGQGRTEGKSGAQGIREASWSAPRSRGAFKTPARLPKRGMVLTFCVRSVGHLPIFARASWLT